MINMLAELRKEAIPMVITIVLLGAALRYWLADVPIPDNLSILLTAIVSWYFGSRTGQAAATRALNGQAPADGAH